MKWKSKRCSRVWKMWVMRSECSWQAEHKEEGTKRIAIRRTCCCIPVNTAHCVHTVPIFSNVHKTWNSLWKWHKMPSILELQSQRKKYARGQIVLTVPPSGTESAHLARATQGLDGPFLLTPLWGTAKYLARCHTGGDSPGFLSWICLQGNSSGHKPGWASWVQTCSLQERLFCSCFS